MKRLLNPILALLLIASLPALAQTARMDDGGDVGHGGQTRDGVLRDLQDRNNCDWYKFSDFAAKSPQFARIMASLHDAHWLLARQYRDAMADLMICATSELRLLSSDLSEFTTYKTSTNQGVRQIAIRYGDRVWLDIEQFRQLSPEQQGWVLFHEETHSFIDRDEAMRDTKVRSFVAAVNANMRAPDPGHLYDQIRGNGVRAIPDFEPYRSLEPQYAILTDPSQSELRRYLALLEMAGHGRAQAPYDFDFVDALVHDSGKSMFYTRGKLGVKLVSEAFRAGDFAMATRLLTTAPAESMESDLTKLLEEELRKNNVPVIAELLKFASIRGLRIDGYPPCHSLSEGSLDTCTEYEQGGPDFPRLRMLDQSKGFFRYADIVERGYPQNTLSPLHLAIVRGDLGLLRAILPHLEPSELLEAHPYADAKVGSKSPKIKDGMKSDPRMNAAGLATFLGRPGIAGLIDGAIAGHPGE